MRLIACGAGRTGSMVADVAVSRGHVVAARLTSKDNAGGSGLTPEMLRDADVVIDFTRAEAVLDNVRACGRARKPIVVGTTGWDREPGARRDLAGIVEDSGIAVLVAPNFSLGAHLFRKVVEAAAALAGNDADLDLWIEEAHHRGKADHPSGTALALATSVLERVPRKTRVLNALPAGPVPPDALVVASARGGWQPGLHRLVIDGPEECITLQHEARSRRVFALGAVRAAEWIVGRRGLFTLDDMLMGDRA